MNITPIGSYVLLKKRKEEQKPRKLIITATSIDPFPFQGVIIKSGSDCKKVWSANEIVRYLPHADQKIDDEYILVKEENVIAIIGE